jgi:transposase-like protein
MITLILLQRAFCATACGRTFLLEYTYAGQSPAVKQQIVDMAMNASGIRDTARVLHVSPATVIKELKKRHPTSSR